MAIDSPTLMAEHNHCCGHDHDHHEHSAQLDKYEQAFAKYELNLSDERVSETVRDIIATHREKYNTPEVLRTLLSTVELTTLTVTDSHEKVLNFTESVNRWSDSHPDLLPIATICVYPRFASTVSQNLEADGVKVACVSGGFPASQTFLEVKTVETALALGDGADEIDMVLSVGAFQSDDYETCADEIAELKAVCGDRALKVILETGELVNASNIKKASLLAYGQNACSRHARSSTRDVQCHSGIPAAGRSPRGLQGGGRHQDGGRSHRLLHHRGRNPRRRVLSRRPLPHRHEPSGQPPRFGHRRPGDCSLRHEWQLLNHDFTKTSAEAVGCLRLPRFVVSDSLWLKFSGLGNP